VPGRFPLFTDAFSFRMVYWPQEDYRLWTIGELR